MKPALLSISFKENQFVTLKRSVTELYGPTDFLAKCGGILGLFMGVSFLSIIEVIYYFTLRRCLRRRHQRKSVRIQNHQVDPNGQRIPNIIIEEGANTSTEDKKDYPN